IATNKKKPPGSVVWVARASRALANASHGRGLSKACFGETPKPTRETRALPREFSQNHARIDPAETEGIAQNVIQFRRAASVRDHVEIAPRIGLVSIQRRGHPIFIDS